MKQTRYERESIRRKTALISGKHAQHASMIPPIFPVATSVI